MGMLSPNFVAPVLIASEIGCFIRTDIRGLIDWAGDVDLEYIYFNYIFLMGSEMPSSALSYNTLIILSYNTPNPTSANILYVYYNCSETKHQNVLSVLNCMIIRWMFSI